MVLQIVLFYLGLFKTLKGKAQFIAPFFAPEKLQFLWIPSWHFAHCCSISSCSKSCFFLRFVVLQIVLFFCISSCNKNRAFFCVSSCSKSCFFLRFVVFQIVLFSCSKSCFLLRFVVLQIVLFSSLFCVGSCSKSCPCLRLEVHQIVLFSCAKSCSFLLVVVHQIVLFFEFLSCNMLFSAFRRAPNCAQKFLSFFLPKHLIKEIFIALCG